MTSPLHEELGVGNLESISFPPVSLSRAEVAHEMKNLAAHGSSKSLRSDSESSPALLLSLSGIPGLFWHAFERWFKGVLHHFQIAEPVIHPSEIAGVNPLFPKVRRISRRIEPLRPRQEPQDVDSFSVIFNCARRDRFERKRTDLNFDGDRNAINICGDIWPDCPERTFKHHP